MRHQVHRTVVTPRLPGMGLSSRAAGLALVLAATGLSVPLALDAQAATPVEKLFVTGDLRQTHDGLAGLYTEVAPSSAPTAVVAESSRVHVRDVSSSADGTRVIYVQDTLSSTGARLSSQILLRDVSSRLVRVMASVTSPQGLSDPVLSANGINAAWALYGGGAVRLVKSSLDPNVVHWGPTTISVGLVPHAFLDDRTVLAHDLGGNAKSITFTGSVLPVSGMPATARHAAVSAGHTHVAWARLDTSVPSGAPKKAAIQVAPLLAQGGQFGSWTVGAPVTLTSSAYNDQPAFTPDGNRLYWVHSTGEAGAPGDISSSPVDLSSPPSAVGPTGGDEKDVAVLRTDDGTPPGAIVRTAGSLNGASSGVGWTLPDDEDISGAVVVRRLDGVAQRAVFLPAGSYLSDRGLVLGKTYEYVIAPVDRSNHYGPETTRMLTAADAEVYFTSPTSWSSATASFPITFGPVSAPGVTFTARVNNDTFVENFAARSAIYAGVPGGHYEVDVEVRDAYGNYGFDHLGPAVVPMDQTIATFTGGANVYTKDAFLGSYRKLWRSGDLARVSFGAYRVQIVGATCPTCGAFDLYDHGKWVKRIDTYSPVTRLRRLVYEWYWRSYSDNASHAYTIKPIATGDRRDVIVDGFATI